MISVTSNSSPLAAQARGAISMSVPRLADFSYANKASLISPVVLRTVFRGIEGVLVGVIGFVISVLYVTEPFVSASLTYGAAHVAVGATTVVALELFGLYRMTTLSAALPNIPRVLLGWAVAFTALVASVFFMKLGTEFSRVWLAAWFSLGSLGLIATRFAFSATLRRLAQTGRLYRRAAIYGGGDVTATLIAQFEADMSTDIRICGIFDERVDDRSPSMVSGYPFLGGLADLVATSRSTRIDLVIVALPITAEDRVAEVTKALRVLPAEIKLPARATKLRFTPGTYSHVGSVAMIDLYDKPIADWGTVSKYAFDKIVGLVALILLAPVMAAIAVAIKLDSRGPVLFRQKRYGFNNELIEVFKFRSMYSDLCDAKADRLVTKDDPRVTDIGRFIRKTSIDELPQLFNVLIGNLSLVGPRPHAMQAKADNRLYDEVVDGYFERHRVKPGITGWAQINGWRGETDTAYKIEQRVAHDLYYIENWSLFLDAYILAKTPFALFTKSENAY
jgi:Undecaprenyl-phosphate glucose phosphotransferase